MGQHRAAPAPRRMPSRVTLVQLVLVCLPLAGFIGWSVGTSDIEVTECWSNPDVKGTYC